MFKLHFGNVPDVFRVLRQVRVTKLNLVLASISFIVFTAIIANSETFATSVVKQQIFQDLVGSRRVSSPNPNLAQPLQVFWSSLELLFLFGQDPLFSRVPSPKFHAICSPCESAAASVGLLPSLPWTDSAAALSHRLPFASGLRSWLFKLPPCWHTPHLFLGVYVSGGMLNSYEWCSESYSFDVCQELGKLLNLV